MLTVTSRGHSSTKPARETVVPTNPLSPHVLALRALASAGGCPYRAPCGCAAPKCNLYGGLATPERCVACLGLTVAPTPRTP